jgi:hypothetical protein
MNNLSKHLNDIKPFKIGAFSENEAKDFIAILKVDDKVKINKSHKQHILDKLIWYLPFFIQLLVEKINYMICVDGYIISNDTIDKAYNQLIAEDHFDPWYERLKDYGTYKDNTRTILNICAKPPFANKSRDELLAELSSNAENIEEMVAQSLKMLENDGYLFENNGKYTFRSPLLRDFWYRRFIR